MIKLITAPTVEPVTLSEVKAHCVISHDDDNALLAMMISAAREYGEALTGRSWAEKTLELILDGFPGTSIIELPMSPINPVTSVKNLDADGVEQTMPSADYVADIESMVGRIVAEEWPETKETVNAVRIRYTAGWSTATVPVTIKHWLLIRVATMYEHREALSMVSNQRLVESIPRNFVDGLLDQYTILGGL